MENKGKGEGVGRVGGGVGIGKGTGKSMHTGLSKLPFSDLPFSFPRHTLIFGNVLVLEHATEDIKRCKPL